MKEQWKRVEVVSIKEADVVEGIDLSFISIKECFANASKIALMDARIQYVEGYVILHDIPIPINHAWNKVGDVYFDVTFELKLDRHVGTYFSVIEMNNPILEEYKKSIMSPMMWYFNKMVLGRRT